MKIYTKIGEEHKKDLYEFLKAGFCEPGSGVIKFVETWANEAYTIQQCHPARRSFEDLLDISVTVFPDTSEKMLAEVLFRLSDNNNLITYFCPDIRKNVFLMDGWAGRSSLTCNDENKTGRGKYSTRMVWDLAGRKYPKEEEVVKAPEAPTVVIQAERPGIGTEVFEIVFNDYCDGHMTDFDVDI